MKILDATIDEIDYLLRRVEVEQMCSCEFLGIEDVEEQSDQETLNEIEDRCTFLGNLSQALFLLKQYRSVGLEPVEVAELADRNTAKPPEKVDAQPYFRKHFQPHVCPKCRHQVYDSDRFCSKCGQKLKEPEKESKD